MRLARLWTGFFGQGVELAVAKTWFMLRSDGVYDRFHLPDLAAPWSARMASPCVDVWIPFEWHYLSNATCLMRPHPLCQGSP